MKKRKLPKWLRNILKWYSSNRGSIVLGPGKQEVDIKTGREPCKVWLSICDDGVAACGGTVSFLGVVLKPDGFCLLADVQSATAIVDWIAES